MLQAKYFIVIVAGMIVLSSSCTVPTTVTDRAAAAEPRLDGGQTLGSGHRSDGDDEAATGTNLPMAADSTMNKQSGQTLGSGH